LLILYAAPRVRLEGQAPGINRLRRGRSAAVLVIAGAIVALASLPTPTAQAATSNPPAPPLEVSIDLAYKTVNAGDEVEFTTVVTNKGTVDSAKLNVAMNIVKTGKGDPVDPEDWSPERTQDAPPLPPGETVEMDWVVEAILEGDYMVYMTVIPKPSGPKATSQPVASPGIHLTVKAFADTNPGGVLPVAIITPAALILIALLPRRRWRRRADKSVDSESVS